MGLNQSHLNFIADISKTDDTTRLRKLFDQYLKDNGLRAYVHGFSCFDADVTHNPQAVFMHSTLPQELLDVYFEEGGITNDPIAATIFNIDDPFFLDMADLPENMSGHNQNPFIQCCVADKFDAATVFPIKARNGAGSMFVWADGATYNQRNTNARNALTSGMQHAVRMFHETIFKGRHVADSFNLTPKELEALRLLTQGNSASDIAAHLDISERAVEKRLSVARKKIGATNSVNAVYRAAVLNII